MFLFRVSRKAWQHEGEWGQGPSERLPGRNWLWFTPGGCWLTVKRKLAALTSHHAHWWQRLQSQGTEKREIKIQEWVQKEGEIKASSFPSSASGPSAWPCESQFCCVSWCLFSLGVHLQGQTSVKRTPPPIAEKNSCPARDPEQHQLAGQASYPCSPCIPALVLPGGVMGSPGTGGCSLSFLLTPSE